MIIVVLIQFVGYWVLAVIALCAFITAPVLLPSVVGYVRRARWLLCVLWIVLAFSTPGESFQNIAWAPTYEGISEANIQAVRLLLTLICLAWLFSVLHGDRLLVGLSGVLMPLEFFGVKVSSLLVRLSLVLENLQAPSDRGSWRKILSQPNIDCASHTEISLTMPPWRIRDGAILLGFVLIIAGGMFW
jgi:hypothetical protein